MTLIQLTDEGKAEIKICIGLMLIVLIHAIYLITGYYLIELTELDTFIVMVILVAYGDIVALSVIIVRRLFNIRTEDMDKIKVDDLPVATAEGE